MGKWQKHLLFLWVQLVLEGLEGIGACSEIVEASANSVEAMESLESSSERQNTGSGIRGEGTGEGSPNLTNITDTNLENIPPR